MGLVILVVLGLYLLVSVGVVRYAARWARKRERRPWVWGGLAAFVMYNLVFWDWIPTMVAHKYYCATQAGFWVYKTLDQWKAENPRVMETLKLQLKPHQSTPFGEVDRLDDRFAIETRRRRPIPFLSTTISERRLLDAKTGEVLERAVDVGSGVGNIATGGGWKFWLNQKPCAAMEFWNFTAQLEQMRGRK